MIDISQINYSKFDHPLITRVLFHPRPEWSPAVSRAGVESVLIPVEKNVVIGARFYLSGGDQPNMLFFHGNGEVVADYGDLGVLYADMGINFLPVDYRGYGRSTGMPSVTAMMRDCHVIFDFVMKWREEKKFRGPFIVMGRSLGSASALELAYHYRDMIDGLIIESGFAYAGPLFRLMGINMEMLGISEAEGFRNVEKIESFDKPTLIIHAEYDHIISFKEGQILFDACPARNKKLLKVFGANHNDIFFRGMKEYLESIKWLIQSCTTPQ